jgi:hypothetical protein
MFPHSDSISKKLDGKSLIENSSVLQDMKENANSTIEGYSHYTLYVKPFTLSTNKKLLFL